MYMYNKNNKLTKIKMKKHISKKLLTLALASSLMVLTLGSVDATHTSTSEQEFDASFQIGGSQTLSVVGNADSISFGTASLLTGGTNSAGLQNGVGGCSGDTCRLFQSGCYNSGTSTTIACNFTNDYLSLKDTTKDGDVTIKLTPDRTFYDGYATAVYSVASGSALNSYSQAGNANFSNVTNQYMIGPDSGEANSNTSGGGATLANQEHLNCSNRECLGTWGLKLIRTSTGVGTYTGGAAYTIVSAGNNGNPQFSSTVVKPTGSTTCKIGYDGSTAGQYADWQVGGGDDGSSPGYILTTGDTADMHLSQIGSDVTSPTGTARVPYFYVKFDDTPGTNDDVSSCIQYEVRMPVGPFELETGAEYTKAGNWHSGFIFTLL